MEQTSIAGLGSQLLKELLLEQLIIMTSSSNIALEPAFARPFDIESKVAAFRPFYMCDKSAP
jgi:hypothetical protein